MSRRPRPVLTPLLSRRARPRPAGPDIDGQLAHIREISQNARTNWFGLLALLAFVGVALLGHEDADFFARGVETQLPLVNFAVPTQSFFLAASLLIAALYIYLHLYLLALWDALADVPQAEGARPLGDRVYPWLLAQTALWYRNRRRPDEPPSASRRVFAWLTVAISVLFGWGFGLVVLGFLWWQTMPAHAPSLTLLTGAAFAVSAGIGTTTFLTAAKRLRGVGREAAASSRLTSRLALWAFFALVAVVSLERTAGDLVIRCRGDCGDDGVVFFDDAEQRNRAAEVEARLEGKEEPARVWTPLFDHPLFALAAAYLVEAELTPRPASWQPYDLWREDYEEAFRKRHGLPPRGAEAEESIFEDKTALLSAEVKRRYGHYLGSIRGAQMLGADLRDAFLWGAFLPSADLRAAEMQGADLSEAQMQGADLTWAEMQGANLRQAAMQGANLRQAAMQRANLSQAEMQGAVLTLAKMQGANLRQAAMQGADLARAQIQGADLTKAEMQGADLPGAKMQGANLTEAHMQGANLTEAQMQGADLRGAEMQGADLVEVLLQEANLGGADLSETDLTLADLSGADLDRAKLDRAVLKQSNLSHAALRSAKLNDARLFSTRLDGALLGGADLSGADCNLASFRNAVLHAANLGCANLSQPQLDGAIGNDATVLPEGLTVLSCFAELPAGFEKTLAHARDPEDVVARLVCPSGEAPRVIGAVDDGAD